MILMLNRRELECMDDELLNYNMTIRGVPYGEETTRDYYLRYKCEYYNQREQPSPLPENPPLNHCHLARHHLTHHHQNHYHVNHHHQDQHYHRHLHLILQESKDHQQRIHQ
ncbi:MAG: hypothetical protein ACKPKO_13450 [Candidatus Fonsibacter sp.]